MEQRTKWYVPKTDQSIVRHIESIVCTDVGSQVLNKRDL
jgi:hypothetical protein